MWKLVWQKNSDKDGTFVIYCNDQIILTKEMYGNAYKINKTNGPTDYYLTFVESCFVFVFEKFNEFITNLESDIGAFYLLDMCDGEESFKYNAESKIFTITLTNCSSTMYFTIKLDDESRLNFANEFKIFLVQYTEYLNSKQNITKSFGE